MRVVIKNCDEFYNTFKYVETLASEVKVMCDEHKMWLQVYQVAGTAMAEVKFPAEYFEEYVCEAPVTVGVHTKIFLNMLKNTYKKKGVTLKMQASDAVDYILITVIQEDEKHGKVECAYQMKLVEIVSDVMQVPEPAVHSEYKLTVATLKKWKDFIFSNCEYVTFTPKQNQLTLESEDENKHKLKLTDDIESNCWQEETTVERTSERDGTTFTETICRKWQNISIGSINVKLLFDLMTFGKKVRVQFFIEQMPVECSVKLDEGVYIRVFIAPRIGDDEEEENEASVETPAPVRTKKRKTMDETEQQKAIAAH